MERRDGRNRGEKQKRGLQGEREREPERLPVFLAGKI